MGINESAEKKNISIFRMMTAEVWETLSGQLPLLVQQILKETDKNTTSPIKQGYEIWLKLLKQEKVIDNDTYSLLLQIKDDPFPLNWVEMLMTRMSVFSHNISSIMNIYDLDRQYDNLAATTPHPAPVDNLIRSMIIDPKRTNENRAELKKHGFSETQIDNIVLSYYRTVDEGTLRTCYLRDIITEKTLFERMHELGYTTTRIKEIVATWEVIPGPGDLFTMVAKEAFEPEMYQKMGLDSEFPTEQLKWLKKQGISEYWAKKYWYAHWEQPSIGQGFEMLHRGVIDKSQLDLLFRTVEIPPYWRDKLTQIAYNPYTRVDVRRMHDLGILSDEQLVKSYLDLGYDSEKAVHMAEFTIKYNRSHEKELTRGAILRSYKKGLIDNITAKSLLTAQDYSSDLADYYLNLTDYELEQDNQDLLFDNIKDYYLLNKKSRLDTVKSLTDLGIKSNKIDAIIESWDIDRYKYQSLPSKSELTDFYIKGIITETQMRDLYTQHGYSAGHINWYITAINQEIKGGARRPTKADLEKWLIKKIISMEEYVNEMQGIGYGKNYIRNYLIEMGVKESKALTVTA